MNKLVITIFLVGCSASSEPENGPKAVIHSTVDDISTSNSIHVASGQSASPSAVALAAKVAPKDAKKAQTLYDQRCVACHGKTGKGDGPAANSLNPKPRDYSSKKWQASVTDAHIAKVISKGGVAVGKSAMMPANPDIKGKTLDAMVALIRSFAQ